MTEELAPTLLVAGTASHVGKSTVTAGLCRYLADRGVDVVPFKAQNMSNNARAVPKAETANVRTGTERSDLDGRFGEIGVSQYVQARAARISPTTDLNPVLLKPRGAGESQLVLDGEALVDYDTAEYYERYWERARTSAEASWRRLAREHEAVIAEGAGSIAEINLHDRDLANLELVRFADADVLLVADIERGGVFASLLGTLELLPADVRERVIGAVITKFRGERSLLTAGIEAFEERTGVGVLGVLPYEDPGLPEEDSLSLPGQGERAVRGRDGVPDERSITVVVPRLPRISNFTDLEPLASEPGVQVAYRPLEAGLAGGDAVVVPGSKNTVDDLIALREAGVDRELRRFDGPILGLCGGYQMLGERITNADLEGTGSRETLEGVGLLPVETRFEAEKCVTERTLHLDGTGPLAGAEGTVSGYEIHAGYTGASGELETPFAPDRGAPGDANLGAAVDDVLGTYLHGLFENRNARRAFVESTFAAAGTVPPPPSTEAASPYDRAARLCEEHLDLRTLFERAGIPGTGGGEVE